MAKKVKAVVKIQIQGGKANLAGWVGAMGLGFGAFGLLATVITLAMVLAGAALLVVGLRRGRRAAAAP
jgi:hypothetical protein